jgi:hypothetical protein
VIQHGSDEEEVDEDVILRLAGEGGIFIASPDLPDQHVGVSSHR